MTNNLTDNALLQQMLGMTEADLSILRASLMQSPEPETHGQMGFGRKKNEIHLATSEGSANERLWQQFEQRGWLARRDVEGLTEAIDTRFFALLPTGREPIAAILAQRDSVHRNRTTAMSKLHNEKCLPFVAELVTGVKSAGGDGRDIATLIALTLKSTIQQIATAGREDAVLDQVTTMVRDTLKREEMRATS